MIVVLLATAAVLAVVERFPRWRFRSQRLLRAHAGSDLVYLGTGWLVGASAALAYVEIGTHLVGASGVPRWADLHPPLWVTVPLALVLIDAGNYAAHWLLHRVDALWQLHKVHHSSRQLDWLATFRSHILEQVLRRLLAPALLIAVGVPMPAVALAGVVFTAWAVVNHANLRFGPPWFERLFLTPRLHRMHHDPVTSEHNLGTVLTIWDRLRGTLVTAEPAAHEFGVPGELESYPQDWLRQLVEPFGKLRLRTLGRVLPALSQTAGTAGPTNSTPAVPAVVDAGTVRSSV